MKIIFKLNEIDTIVSTNESMQNSDNENIFYFPFNDKWYTCELEMGNLIIFEDEYRNVILDLRKYELEEADMSNYLS